MEPININLDCETVDPAELHNIGKTLLRLSDYAHAKADAMTYRARGKIVRAQLLEAKCENIYRDLPQWAKW